MKLTHETMADAHVRLEPLTAARAAALSALASANPDVFAHWPRAVTGGYAAEVDWLLAEQAAGRWLVHVVVDTTGAIVGQTCFLALRPDHSGVEIGGTWYGPAAQGTAVNPAAKRLLLSHAFSCGAERVELKTDARNARSRAAILKLGATFEGVFRQHMRRPDGTWRDTAWFSILREEWPGVKAGLDLRLIGAS
jgi:N-acetyltransferase